MKENVNFKRINFNYLYCQINYDPTCQSQVLVKHYFFFFLNTTKEYEIVFRTCTKLEMAITLGDGEQ